MSTSHSLETALNTAVNCTLLLVLYCDEQLIACCLHVKLGVPQDMLEYVQEHLIHYCIC
jgi:hypothetical protein